MSPVVVIGPSGEPRGGVSRYVDDVLAVLGASGVRHAHLQTRAPVPSLGQTRIEWGRKVLAKARTFADIWRLRPEPGAVAHLHLGFHRPAVNNALLRLTASRGFARVVATLHGGHPRKWTALLARRDVVSALSRADVIHVQTRAVEAVFAGSPLADRVVCAPMAIDRSATTGVGREPGAPLRVVYVGVVTPRKGVPVLLEAIGLARSRGLDARLTLIGLCDRGYEAAFRRDLAALDARFPGAVEWRGHQPEGLVFEALATHHVFAMATSFESEGTPLSVIEAMSASLPPVVTRCGGLVDLVEDGVHGRLIDRADAAAFADAFEALAKDEATRRAWGDAASSRFERLYSRDALIAHLAWLYGIALA